MFDNREIYAVTLDGDKDNIYFDPMSLRRTLLVQSSGRCWEWIKEVKSIVIKLDELPSEDDSEKAKATRAELSMRLSVIEGELADAAYHAFGMEPINLQSGEGITETQVLKILAEYIGWVEIKKGSAGNSLIS